RAFGKTIAQFQNTQFRLAELATEVEIGQVFVDRLLAAHLRRDEIVAEVSMAKWWSTELQKRLTAQCLQLHGGYGFMMEYPIATDYADAAVRSIYAGSNEIRRVIIARRLGLGDGGRRVWGIYPCQKLHGVTKMTPQCSRSITAAS